MKELSLKIIVKSKLFLSYFILICVNVGIDPAGWWCGSSFYQKSSRILFILIFRAVTTLLSDPEFHIIKFPFHIKSIRCSLDCCRVTNSAALPQAAADQAVMVCARLPSFSAAFEFGALLQIKEEAALAAALNDYLASRSYLAGFSPSQADRDRKSVV